MAHGEKTGGRDWEKGQSGNPAGRPKRGETFTDALRARIDRDWLAAKLQEFIDAGNIRALTYAYDRLDGMPKQSVDVRDDRIQEWQGLVRGIFLDPESEAASDSGSLQEGATEGSDT